MKYIVLDPNNSDASFGPLDEAEIWLIEDGKPLTHTGQAFDDGRVDFVMPIENILKAAAKLFQNHEYSGKYAVVDAFDAVALQNMLRRIGIDV